MNILIKECTVLPLDGREGDKYFCGHIGIEGDKIALITRDVGQAELFRKKHEASLRVIDGRGKLAMPGLVNIHNHVSMTLLRSYADDMALMEWLNDHIWPFEAKENSEDIMVGAELGIAEMLLGGTTTFADMYWEEIAVAEAVKKSGIRAVLSPTFTDTRWEDFEKDFAAVADAYASGQEPRITLMVAPHSVYSTSRVHLLKAKELSEKYGIGINIHVSETMDEQNTMRERIDMTPTEYLDELGMLTPSTLAVHCVHVSDSDIEILSKRGVSVAHNPHSNMKLASGVSPVAKMLEAGINVGIGTDGPSSNNDLDMWEEFRTASFLAKLSTGNPQVLPAYQVLEMATVNGAKALGLGDKVGQLKEGMMADVILLDMEKPHLYPKHDIVANLVYAAKAGDVETVIVNGEIVVEGGKTVNIDTLEICRKAQKQVEQIVAR